VALDLAAAIEDLGEVAWTEARGMADEIDDLGVAAADLGGVGPAVVPLAAPKLARLPGVRGVRAAVAWRRRMAARVVATMGAGRFVRRWAGVYMPKLRAEFLAVSSADAAECAPSDSVAEERRGFWGVWAYVGAR